MNRQTLNLNMLENSWTAEVKLNNDQVITIWYTCWPSIKSIVKEVLSVTSDYPRYKIRKQKKIYFASSKIASL